MTLGKRAGSERSCRTGRRQGSGRWVMALLLTVLGIGVVFLSAPAPAGAPVSSWPALAEGNTAPVALWSDDDILWVADYWEQYVYAYDLATGDRLPASDIDVEGLYPSGLWGDEETLWVLDYTGGLFAYSLATGAPDEPADIASVGPGIGLWSDGETLWVTDYDANATGTLKAYDFSGQRLPEEDITTLSAAGNRSPIGMWSDGETLWVADSVDGKLYAYDLATAERVPAWDLDTLEPDNNAPMGVWSDGETVWVADYDAATVHAYVLPGVEADAHAGSVSEGNEDLPDGRLATPGVVVVGDSVTGTIEPAGDRDGYAVELEAGTTYQIDLEGAATGQGTLADPFLRWLRGRGRGIPGTRDDNGGEGLNARQVFTPAESGTYYISARAAGAGTGTYRLSVMVQPSNDARLGTLELSGITLDGFSSDVTDYSVSVAHSVAETTVSALAVDAGASLSIDPATDADSEADGHQVALAAGATTVITLTVTAADGSVQATTVRVTRAAPPSSDARLGTLELSGIALDGFSSDVTDYSVSVAHSVAETTVSALAVDAGASVSIDPATDADTEASGHQVALAAGATTVITITVTAADGSVQATTVRVTRASSSDARLGTLELSGITLDAFSSDVTDYSVSVAHGVAETTVSATVADAGASLSIDPATDADAEADGHQVALAAGATTVITVTVTAADGSVQATTVRVTRAASNDARLGTLQLSGIALDAFSSDVTDYSVSVAHGVAETTVSATVADAGASLSIDPATDADSAANGHQVALVAGATTVITITVTAADGSVQATTVRIARAASSDARLGTLQLSGIALDAFSSDVTDYSVSVAHSVAEITVSATPADSGASLSIDPATDADSAADGHQVALAAGATTVITITVTAADGSVQATTVRISRAASSDARLGTLQLSGIALDAFSSDVTDYSVSVAHSVAEITVSATPADSGASLSIDPATDADAEADGHQVALAAGATTVITVTVTAADGSVQATTVRISRAASSDARLGTLQLSGIALDAFSSDVTDYSVSVAHSVAETTVSALAADAGASLSIDPATDADSAADGHQVALAAGATTVITITVTAADGSVQATTVRIARAASSDARLGTLELSGITLDVFSSDVTDYSVAVAHSVAETTVSATVADSGASLSIDPATDADSAADGHQVALAAGATTVITITVTAADGSVQATTVRIARAASSDARLGTLQLSGIALDAFSSDVTDYSVAVAHSVVETTVSATAADSGASLSIDPATDADPEADGHQVALAAGATTVITITVTAADGSVQATTVRVTRAASSDARLATLQLSGINMDTFSSDVTDYSVSVAHSVAETTVSALAADAGASLSIDPATDADPEADGHQVALAAGATTVITLTVTAADGTVQATTVWVTRAAPPSNDARLGTLQLSGIALDAFSSDVTDYSVSVAHSVAETTVSALAADAGASLSIDPATDADPEADGHQVALAAGATTVITVTVTAADGSAQATTVRITRAASSDARLGTLQLSGINMDAFSSDVTDYSVAVAHSVAEITVSATVADAGASVSIDPATDADTEADGHQVALAAGATTVITVTVTAADGTVRATTVRITRAGAAAALPAEMTRHNMLNSCPAADSAPTPTVVEVTAVPIVVASTTDDYFVLYVRHDLDADTAVELPVSVTLGEAGTTRLAENIEALPAERYRVEKYLIADPADVDGDCIDDITELADPVGMNPVNPAAAIALSNGAVAIPDRNTFETLAVSGRYVKFAVFGADTDRPHIYFINTNTHTYHGGFQQALTALGIEESRAGDRFNGLLTFHPELQSAGGSPGLYSIWIYRAEPFAVNNFIYTLFAANMPLLEDDFAFHLREQLQLAYRDMPLYEESRMHLLLDGDVAPEGDFVPINKAEGYGLLRSMDLEDSPNPRDVVIYEALPNELPRVAGIITTVAQTPLSHVNLRAVQDGVPNAFIRGALDKPDINALIGHYVQYTVTADGYTIRAATKAEIDNYYASSRPATAQTPQRDLSVTEITPLRWIGFDDWDAFGVKAANVAVLRALDFPEGTVPDGFAIPFYFYDEFMKHNGFYDDIREMLADPDFQSDFDTQESELKKLRKAIKKAETPQWIIDAIVEMNQGFPEGINRRYRSSTNNEDLPGFSGAGLYDSKSQKPSEDEEDLAKSLKEVYASLWNFRAFVERDFHRIDHLAASMGILVHPSYQDEKVNGVAVSFDLIAGRFDYYYVNSQIGEDLVTNPEALSVPEEVLLDIYGGAILLGASNQVAPGQRLMSDDQLLLLRDHLFVIHHRFERLYQPAADEPFAMEIEFKITSDDILAIKQARPWVFGDP